MKEKLLCNSIQNPKNIRVDYSSSILFVVMSGIIKLFHTLKIFYKTIGVYISQSESSQLEYSFNAINVFLLISPIPLYISSTAYFLFKAQTPDENGTSFYISITILAIAINISNIVWKMAKILTLINRYEEFISKSLFMKMFLETFQFC